MNFCYNFDLNGIITPVNPDRLEQLLRESHYDEEETEFLCRGFREGFDIGYEGPEDRRDKAANIPIKVGSHAELWTKIMKEVKLKRYSGSFNKPPYNHYIQSPISLVPKSGGKMRLIFHLSYDFKKGEPGHESVNFYTAKEKCSVKYKDLDFAVKTIFEWCEPGKCMMSKTDVVSAFHLVLLNFRSRKFLLMKARSPMDGKWYYFVENNLPFGSSIISVVHIFRGSVIQYVISSNSELGNTWL